MSQYTRVTDRRTDRILITIPRLHYMQRGKKNATFDYLVVKTFAVISSQCISVLCVRMDRLVLYIPCVHAIRLVVINDVIGSRCVADEASGV